MYNYKISQLLIMLEEENNSPENKQYGVHLSHWSDKAKPINIDIGAIECLIEYYQNKGD